jgi:hypothetical protein
MLPFCGANGLALVPAFASWLGYRAWRDWPGGRGARARAAGLLLTALASIGLIFVYKAGMHRLHPPSPSYWVTLRAAFQFFTMGLGQITPRLWWVIWPIAAGVLGLTILALLVRAFRRSADRLAAVGYLLYLLAFASLAVGIGWGRAGLGDGDPGFAPRYVTLAAPIVCCLYLMWGLGARGPSGSFGEMWCFTLVCALCIANFQEGFACGLAQRGTIKQFERDLKAGMTPEQLAERYQKVIYPSAREMDERMPYLKSAGNKLFRSLNCPGGEGQRASLR